MFTLLSLELPEQGKEDVWRDGGGGEWRGARGVCGERSLEKPPSFHVETSVPRKCAGVVPPMLAGPRVRHEPQMVGATVLLDFRSVMGKEALPSHKCCVMSLVRGLPEDVPYLTKHQRLFF